MPVAITHVPDATAGGNAEPLVTVQLIGTLDRKDYRTFVPQLDLQIREHGRLRLMIELVDFTGWTPGGAWEDAKFAFEHYHDVERIAVVGDKRWEKGMTSLLRPFTAGQVRYFDVEDRDGAERWVRSPIES